VKQNESYIEIVRQGSSSTRVTDIFAVRARGTAATLGEIRWHWSWRKYCFFPKPNTLFDHGCLRDIANFCESETRKHRARPARLPDTSETAGDAASKTTTAVPCVPSRLRSDHGAVSAGGGVGPAAEAGERGQGSGVSTETGAVR